MSFSIKHYLIPKGLNTASGSGFKILFEGTGLYTAVYASERKLLVGGFDYFSKFSDFFSIFDSIFFINF